MHRAGSNAEAWRARPASSCSDRPCHWGEATPQWAVRRGVFVGRTFQLRGPWIGIQSTPAHLSAMGDHAVAVHTLRPRRTLVLVTALALALHWLALSHWPLALNRPVQPTHRDLSVRTIAAAPPPPPPPPP